MDDYAGMARWLEGNPCLEYRRAMIGFLWSEAMEDGKIRYLPLVTDALKKGQFLTADEYPLVRYCDAVLRGDFVGNA